MTKVSTDPGFEIATDTVANTTSIFSLAAKNSGFRFLFD